MFFLVCSHNWSAPQSLLVCANKAAQGAWSTRQVHEDQHKRLSTKSCSSIDLISTRQRTGLTGKVCCTYNAYNYWRCKFYSFTSDREANRRWIAGVFIWINCRAVFVSIKSSTQMPSNRFQLMGHQNILCDCKALSETFRTAAKD